MTGTDGATMAPNDQLTDADAGQESFADWSVRCCSRVERELERVLPSSEGSLARLHEAMRYAVLGGGKRVRPLLAYAAGELAVADNTALDAVAAAVELIHAYSLVHDDLPCMDDDVLRRGRPTVHVAYDEATALLVGDALHALAFEVLAGLGHPRPGIAAAAAPPAAAMVVELARAAGSFGMAGGQAIDLAAVGATLDREAIEEMHRRKTGAMLAVSIRLGWLAGNSVHVSPQDDQAALEHFGAAIGLAFQVVDDILDVEGDAATLGKTVGKDRANGKPTYVSVLGIQAARELAMRLHREALEALDPFGAAALRLRQVADLIVLRRH